MPVGAFAFRIGRAIGKHPLAGRLFCLTQRFLPLRRIASTGNLIAFHHPRPVTEPHVLIVPMRPVSSLTTDKLSQEHLAALIWRMLEFGLEITPRLPHSDAWQLMINGGTRQEIGQLHAHLLHAETESLGGIALSSPADDQETWSRINADLRSAEAIPGNGYSLQIRWIADGCPRAEITQYART